jgi:hypothetical protein
MIDEAYDRAYREGRIPLNGSIIRLLAALAALFRMPHGDTPCAPDPSPPSPSRCR